MSEVPIPEPVRDCARSLRALYELARKRGAGEASGNRNHERFIVWLARVLVREVSAATREVRKRSSEECHALALQRAGSESSGLRNHERFIRDCMAGKVS
jgi:hypothetical protein